MQRTLMLGLVVFAASSALGGLGCSASSTPTAIGGNPAGANGDTPVVSSNETWANGKVLDTPTVIAAGTTVTIAAGATIQAIDGISITVNGTLQSAGGAQATLAATSATTRWAGILVGSGGTLNLAGVDITNADGAINVEGGAASASYATGTITASKAPFTVATGGKLTTSHAKVVGSLGTTHVQGELDASYLDYDGNGNDGLTAESDSAIVNVSDSELHGLTGALGDMIVSYEGAGTISIQYTEIKNVHCSFHIERATNINVSHVTSSGNSFGFMMYGSLDTGTRTIDSMNIEDELAWGIAEEDGDINGPVSFTNTWFANNAYGDMSLQTGTKISVTNNASAEIADAKPR
jgi:hypothetical protein